MATHSAPWFFMYYVYILRSQVEVERLYIGVTKDTGRRVKQHNSENNVGTYTARYKPWVLECYVAVRSKRLAEELEKYLKQGSGFAFMKKHLLEEIG
ncbi:MAG: GIY-YIG nuclease family protein [Patescibacteria group bacterium]